MILVLVVHNMIEIVHNVHIIITFHVHHVWTHITCNKTNVLNVTITASNVIIRIVIVIVQNVRVDIFYTHQIIIQINHY